MRDEPTPAAAPFVPVIMAGGDGDVVVVGEAHDGGDVVGGGGEGDGFGHVGVFVGAGFVVAVAVDALGVGEDVGVADDGAQGFDDGGRDGRVGHRDSSW